MYSFASYLGYKCNKNSDCFGYDDPNSLMVCCNLNGENIKNNENGICTKPCINGNIGYCPNQIKNLKCSKKIGSKCDNDWDCLNWGADEDKTSCCKGICKQNKNCNASNVGGLCKISQDCSGVGILKNICCTKRHDHPESHISWFSKLIT